MNYSKFALIFLRIREEGINKKNPNSYLHIVDIPTGSCDFVLEHCF